MGGKCLLSNLAVSLLKCLTELVNTDAVLVVCVLQVWFNDRVLLSCSGDSKEFFMQVIFLSSLSEMLCSNRPSPVEGNDSVLSYCVGIIIMLG